MKKFIKNILLFILLLVIWQSASQHVNNLFVPKPLKVFNDIKSALLNGNLILATMYSLRRVTLATMLSIVVAVPTGLLIFNVKSAREMISPFLNVLRYIPVTAFYPLFIMWFGIYEGMKIAFLFIAMFVYMMPTVVLSLEEINIELFDTGKTLGMSKWKLITMIQVPASLPSICNSFIMMFGIGFTYLPIAETINAKYGLGYIIQQSSSRGRTDLVFMGIIAITVVSIVFDNTAKKLVRRIFKWRYLDDNAQ